MRINYCNALLALVMITPNTLWAANLHPAEHHAGTYHMFELEIDYGIGEGQEVIRWDLDGWIGRDNHKLWLKSEGDITDGTTEQAEFWAMYSYNVTTFWDVQAGIRYDSQPISTTYISAGIEGVAPFFIETQAHIFISDEGDVSARIRQEKDFLLTQRLVLQPYLEAHFFAQDIENQDVAAGLANADVGVQARYEITRTFAPYIDMRYERLFGATASLAEQRGHDDDDLIVSGGLRMMF